ncbi:MAG: shikimate dehydrogenase [Ginsengibacter sp.]
MQLFGLVGYPLGHSFSKKYFTAKFNMEGLDALYENYETTNLADLRSSLSLVQDLRGLNVTIPYKSQVIDFLDSYDEVVGKLKACNCISIRNGKWRGSNTDVIGFEKSFIKKWKPPQRHALILGTGGSARAVEFVLQKLGIAYLFVSRKKINEITIGYDDINPRILADYTILINTTPTGMYPNVNEYPQFDYDLLTPAHYLFDLIYNPVKTGFLEQGEARGAVIENGYQMLIEQAEESWMIWNAG